MSPAVRFTLSISYCLASIPLSGWRLSAEFDYAGEGGLAVFSDDEQELLDLFNAGLANIVADGTYEEIVSKYLGEAAAADAVASFGTAAETEAE